MIYEVAALSCFILLCLIFLFASFYLSNIRRTFSPKNRKNGAPSTLFRSDMWDMSLRTVIILLLLSRAVLCISGPIEILESNQPDQYFIRFILGAFLMSAIWFIAFILLQFKKEIKTESRGGYQKVLLFSLLAFTMLDLGISLFLFTKAFQSFFIEQFNAHAQFTMGEISTKLPLLVFLAILLLIQLILYALFFIRRSLSHVRQYWISMLLYVSILVFFLMTVVLRIIGWQNSTIIQLKLFSIQYGYLGWIFLLFFAILIISNLCGFTFLQLRNQMTNPQRARNLLSPLLKIGFMGLWGASALSIIPYLFIWLY